MNTYEIESRREIARFASQKREARTVAMKPGQTVETENLRIHLFMDSIRVTDLTYSGKRGKKVERLILTDLDYIRDDVSQERFQRWLKAVISQNQTFRQAEQGADTLLSNLERAGVYPLPKKHLRQLRGVDVDPPQSRVPRVKMKVLDIPERMIEVDAKPSDVSIRQLTYFVSPEGKRDFYKTDDYMTNTRKKRETAALYRWVVQNQKEISKAKTLMEIKQMAQRAGVPYDTFSPS